MLNPTLDVVYLARNRLEFTKATFPLLLANTAWSNVDRLVVYDDGSTDGTAEWLADVCRTARGRHVHFAKVEYRPLDGLGSPVAVMADYLASDPADWFVKLDNDAAVPPGWLQALLAVRDGYPELGIDLLGFEAGMTIVPEWARGTVCVPRGWDGTYGFESSTHIGGIGLMRSGAFKRRSRPLAPAGDSTYNGFTEWQHRNRSVVRGWITPDLRAPLLDRVPAEPYASLSASYVARGWQRPWGAYDAAWMQWAYSWLPGLEGPAVSAEAGRSLPFQFRDLSPDEVPRPAVKKWCVRCQSVGQKHLYKPERALVSPVGTAHFQKESPSFWTVTVCGLDATGRNWWWPL